MPWEEARVKATEAEGRLTLAEAYRLLHGFGDWPFVGNLRPVPSLGVPALNMQDAGNGFRPTFHHEAGTSTQWPCMLAMAATWDEGLVEQVAGAIGREFRGKGANVLLGPAVNVARTAYGGRNFEFLSGEDPHLGSRLAPIYVRAVQAEGVMAVVKHFAFNEQETARYYESSDVDARTAWELYYPPFEAAVHAGAGAVMCSYNRVNGTHACGNDDLLVRDLRGKMGFQGFVMSDWQATHSTDAIKHGLDMEMPKSKWFTRERLDRVSSPQAVQEAVIRVLTSIYHLRLDERPGCKWPCIKERRSNQRTDVHLELARLAATRSVVLLQNDGVLPLDPMRVRKIAVLGHAASATDTLRSMWLGSPYAGGGSGKVMAPEVVTPLEGITRRARISSIEVVSYAGNSTSKAAEVARGADVAVVVAAAMSKEGNDRTSLNLDHDADNLIFTVARVRPTVVLMQTPGAVLTPWRPEVGAVANMFFGGEQTGNAWASVVFGDTSPAGRLPLGFPVSESSVIRPGKPGRVPYSEELFTSYRSPKFSAAYPFGHGLTYTTFSFGKPQMMASSECPELVCLEVPVTNTGRRIGDEVVQAYLHFGNDASEPRLVLRGFKRSKVLAPRESQNVVLSFSERQLSVYRADAGWRRLYDAKMHIGASSSDIRQVITISVMDAVASIF